MGKSSIIQSIIEQLCLDVIVLFAIFLVYFEKS